MDLPILKYLDIFIGLALVMVLACSVVGAITHLMTSAIYLRAQCLRQGLAELLKQLIPDLTEEEMNYAAQLIQRHPLVARPASLPGLLTARIGNYFRKGRWLPNGAPGTVVQRHELMKILLEWAAGQGPLAAPPVVAFTDKLKTALEKLGVTSANDALQALRFQLLAQERAFPEKAAHLWHSAAAIDALPANFVGQIHCWYDAVTTRVTQDFSLYAKIFSSVVGLALVVLLPLDSVELLKRLANDDQFRVVLVERAKDLQAQRDKVADDATKESIQNDLTQVRQEIDGLRSMNLISTGTKYCSEPQKWFESWRWIPTITLQCPSEHVFGLLLSWVLLSLGTPFWYDALKDALKLRSALAKKDEQEKKERQESAAAAATPPGEASALAAGVIAVAAQPVAKSG